ncbi:unnamed protein product, partial [Nesidiocoris tenuis]
LNSGNMGISDIVRAPFLQKNLANPAEVPPSGCACESKCRNIPLTADRRFLSPSKLFLMIPGMQYFKRDNREKPFEPVIEADKKVPIEDPPDRFGLKLNEDKIAHNEAHQAINNSANHLEPQSSPTVEISVPVPITVQPLLPMPIPEVCKVDRALQIDEIPKIDRGDSTRSNPALLAEVDVAVIIPEEPEKDKEERRKKKKKRTPRGSNVNINRECLNIIVSGPIHMALDYFNGQKLNKIVTIGGAGISTAANIPDFRSPDSGLYSKLEKYDLPTPQSVFEKEYFDKNPKPFFALLKEVLRYTGDNRRDWCMETSPHPIITVTEHTPAPSPDFVKHKHRLPGLGSVDSSVDFRKGLRRSKTDSQINYSFDGVPEAPGSSHYITPEGDIDLAVVMKTKSEEVWQDLLILGATKESLGRSILRRSRQPGAPVVSRATSLLECAHFVHQCNKGQWPTWMKHNMSLSRPSGPHNSIRNSSTTVRRSHIVQRAMGNMFYQWAEVERKISFVLQEPDNESEASSNTTLALQSAGPNRCRTSEKCRHFRIEVIHPNLGKRFPGRKVQECSVTTSRRRVRPIPTIRMKLPPCHGLRCTEKNLGYQEMMKKHHRKNQLRSRRARKGAKCQTKFHRSRSKNLRKTKRRKRTKTSELKCWDHGCQIPQGQNQDDDRKISGSNFKPHCSKYSAQGTHHQQSVIQKS